ncbi:zinc metalloproteinase nas-14 [Hyalella azteca]|uniref:Metalloendopeptidase n=1 Tax=Hyalella azteca TaxID=294128 RepID=A0A8B7PBN3_HYAAZ|nr:zinc metalloproteinase nas-14 [Hyalella azteca]
MAEWKPRSLLLALCACYALAAPMPAPMGATRREDGSVLVGDILYSSAQWDGLLSKNLDSLEKLWPRENGVVKIPFKISDSKLNGTLLKLGFSAWQSKTCLEFPELTESDTRKEYLNITIQTGCFSGVGYTAGNVTTISIFGDVCGLKGITHEIGHAIGLHHEHSRSDRNDYVIVKMANVEFSSAHNFFTKDTVNFGVPYDYYSIMHYREKGGSASGERVLLAKDARFQDIMGDAP